MRKLVYLIACSLDGFIGDVGGDATSMQAFTTGDYLDWLTAEYPDTLPSAYRAMNGLEDLPLKRFDTVIQGRGSYQVGLDLGITSPYGHLREIVASRSLARSPHPNVELVREDLPGRVRELKAEDGPLDVWLCGGAEVAGLLLDEIDELVIKTYPQVYGSGMPMFGAVFSVTDFALDDVKTFANGVMVRTYQRKR
ncbi:deaminase [Streptomyces solincola]|uniref:Deaminase n=1 Tax=Streptomyces solincola TaxID=2100817 RepID=A0A2S9PZC1_9ACTN|nr:dihydrofolate reductase family protein [Streptomyces solincola]PRH79748.1 deaminase [Streptomyces solincola]